MKWTDINEIAIALDEEYPDFDVLTIRFTDLRDKVLALVEFDDEPNGCNEKVLEAIQSAWIDEQE